MSKREELRDAYKTARDYYREHVHNTSYDYGHELGELIADGYDYDEAVAMCEFVYGGEEIR